MRQLATRQYQSGFGNEHMTEALPGALPTGRTPRSRHRWACMPSSSAGRRLPSPGRSTGAPGPTGSYRRPRTRRSPAVATATFAPPRSPRWSRRRTGCAGTRCRCPTPRPTPRGAGDARRQWRGRRPAGYGASLRREPLDAARLLRCRRRAADRAAARRLASRPNAADSTCPPGDDRPGPARDEIPVELPEDRRAAMFARITARHCGCPISARSGPTASPTRAISSLRVAWFEDRDEPIELVQKFQGTLWATARPFAVRRGRVARERAPYITTLRVS